MSTAFRCLALVSALSMMALQALAQRDRDTYNVSPQSFEISGQVRLADTREAAPEVQVRLERFSGGIVDQMATDRQGKFRFANLQRGYYKVIINAPGFRPAQQDADLQVVFRAFVVFDLNRDKSTSSSGGLILNDVIDARTPPGAQQEYMRGRAALADKNLEDAISHLEKAVFLYSEFFEAQLLLAKSYMDKRDWVKAESALKRTLEIRPDNASVIVALGEVAWRQKRYDEAEKLLLEGLKLDDKSWHGYFTLGRLYWEQGEVAKAGPPVGMTLQLKPDFAEAHLLAGNILLHVKQQERALVEYQEYLRLAPKGEFAKQTQELVDKISKSVPQSHP